MNAAVNPFSVIDGGLAADPFDPASLALPQDFAGATSVLTILPVRRPKPDQFIRTHPTLLLQSAAIVELSDKREEVYLVRPQWLGLIGTSARPVALFLTLNRPGGALFFWPIRLPDSDGRHDDWSRSALEGARLARDHWISLRSNRGAGYYDTVRAETAFPTPDWDQITQRKTLGELLAIAFNGDRLIDREDHPVIQQLQGRI